ncbi:MAG: glycine cleavage system protein H [Deltaproteobacteria bacterium]|nr:glycine cleavage system protein H [Deltaproteobacteria bacterium]
MAGSRNTSRLPGITVPRNECIWMKVGVVNYKLCESRYNCCECRFDKAMGQKLSRENPTDQVGANWQRIFNELPPEKKYCRHMLTGHVNYKICANAFRCYKCELDQLIEHEIETQDPVMTPGARVIDGFVYPDNFFYHRGHGYAMIDYGGRIKVGLDDFSSRLLGKPEKVDLPMLGEKVAMNATGWTVKREGHEAEMLSPVAGMVTAINYKAVKDPELINQSPYEKGWLYLIEPVSLRENLKSLLSGEAATGWVRSEVGRLKGMISQEVGPTASAGGLVTRDIYHELRDIGWAKLTKEFLLT